MLEVQRQFSAPPLQATIRSYNMVVNIRGVANKGQMSLWTEGSSFKGIMTVTEVFGMPISSESFQIFGQLYQGKLRLVMYVRDTSYGTPEAFGYATTVVPFSFDLDNIECNYFGATLGQKGRFGTGAFSLSRVY